MGALEYIKAPADVYTVDRIPLLVANVDMSYTLFPTLVAVLAAWLVLRLRKVGSRERGLPPGPPTRPLLGNLLEFPTSKIYIQCVRLIRVCRNITENGS